MPHRSVLDQGEGLVSRFVCVCVRHSHSDTGIVKTVAGLVASYNKTSDEHCIRYDDGDTVCHVLPKRKWRLAGSDATSVGTTDVQQYLVDNLPVVLEELQSHKDEPKGPATKRGAQTTCKIAFSRQQPAELTQARCQVFCPFAVALLELRHVHQGG